jgi:hypothetical protein
VFFRQALAHAPLTIFGDGGQTRDFVYVKDVVRALVFAAEAPNATGVLNTGYGVATSILELAHRIRALTGSRSAIVHAPPRAGDVRHSHASVDRLRAIGFEPDDRLETGLAAALAYLRDGAGGGQPRARRSACPSLSAKISPYRHDGPRNRVCRRLQPFGSLLSRMRTIWGVRFPSSGLAIIVAVAVALSAPTISGEDDTRQIALLVHTVAVETSEEASRWRFEALPFEVWLRDITPPGADTLHAAETPEHFAAIQRLDGHLVLWVTHRTQPFGRQENHRLHAADDSEGQGHPVFLPPSKWVNVEHRLTYPGGSFTHRANSTAWAIREDFRGELVVKVTRSNRFGEVREVLRALVPWAP